MDSKSICAIIRECHKAGVSTLKLGELEVTFCQEPNVSHETQFTLPEDAGVDVPLSMEMTSDQRQIMDEAVLTDMMCSDPQGWENHNVDRLVNRGVTLDGRR